MKIRKVFEDMYDRFYPTNWEELNRCMYITEFESEKIIKVFNRLNVIKTGSYYIGSNTYRTSIRILKDIDEWYYVIIVYSSGSLPRNSSGFNHYFKCDQWDGLIECIKMEIFMKNEN